jgi:hypothetical protein
VIDAAVPGFLPSTHGLRFTNDWPPSAAFRIDVLGQRVAVGDARNGLCGGMVFTVRDLFRLGRAVPPDTTAPGAGPLYEYVGQRLKDSFVLPAGPMRYLDLMAAPDGDRNWPLIGWLLNKRTRGIAWRTINDELPGVIAALQRGDLVCLGLICTRSANPFDLGQNHQVLAYRVVRDGADVRLYVYDPNRPGRDDVVLHLSTASPTRPTAIDFENGSRDVRGFLVTPYTPATPP